MSEEKNVGIKSYYRVVTTLEILETMQALTMLRSCLYRKSYNSNKIYYNFVDRFHDVFLSTALFVNKAEIVRKIENTFEEGEGYTTKEEFDKKSHMFINLFKAYMVELKEDGLFNPEINSKHLGVDDAFKDSI